VTVTLLCINWDNGDEHAKERDISFVAETSRKERLTAQKQLLNKTLGLDGGIDLGNIGDELFKEEDLIVEPSSVQSSATQVMKEVYSALHKCLESVTIWCQIVVLHATAFTINSNHVLLLIC